MSTGVKICGLNTAEAMAAALDAGADFVGLVAVASSPRFVPPDAARRLADQARGRARIVLLSADADPADLDAWVRAVRPDWVQLHGREAPEEITRLRADHGIGVIRAVGVRTADDLDGLDRLEALADHLLLDARPPAGADRTGGHGVAFDWSILDAAHFSKPWFLAGGLDPANVGEAVRRTRAPFVDVSSGVERAPGVKDADRITAFVQALRRP